MDQAFLMRAKRLLQQQPAPRPSHQLLIKAIADQREVAPTCAAAARCEADAPVTAGANGLATLILGEAGWRESGARRDGCFSRAVAARRGNTL